jgi:hypothetical protein
LLELVDGVGVHIFRHLQLLQQLLVVDSRSLSHMRDTLTTLRIRLLQSLKETARSAVPISLFDLSALPSPNVLHSCLVETSTAVFILQLYLVLFGLGRQSLGLS